MNKLTVSFNVLDKLQELNTRQFCYNTCFDYVDSFIEEEDRFGVVVFIEPLGNITKFAGSWTEAIDWWIAVLERQPPDWDYALAGAHLFTLQEENRLPDNPAEAWKLRSNDINYGKPRPPLMTIAIQMRL